MNGTLHRSIGEVAAMPLLREMTDRALSRWERLRRHYFQGVLVPRVEQAQREHRELLAALVARDPDGAERVVRAHNRNAQTAYSDFLQGHRPSPSGRTDLGPISYIALDSERPPRLSCSRPSRSLMLGRLDSSISLMGLQLGRWRERPPAESSNGGRHASRVVRLLRTLALRPSPRLGSRAGHDGAHLGHGRGRAGRPAARRFGHRRPRSARASAAPPSTDAQGAYVFVNLPLGTYTVSAELHGLQQGAARSGYVLVADGRLTADFTLDVGSINETVEVTVESETVNTVSGEIARTVDRQQVQNLALNGRNYLQLTTLIPGAPDLNPNALDIMTGLGINTSINGSRTNATLLTVDGGFNMDSGSNNSQISNVGVDFIEEVSIKTANFSAEYGRNSGAAVNVVTRSGANEFHGSVFEYHRNEGLDANNYFNNARNVPRSDLKYNDFGGALGGPIIKDKLFFFAGVEWKQIDRFSTPDAADAADDARCAAATSAQLSDVDPRPAHRPAVPRQHHPGEPDHARRPGDRQPLQPDVGDRDSYTDTADREQLALPDGEPLPLAPGDGAPRLQHQRRRTG